MFYVERHTFPKKGFFLKAFYIPFFYLYQLQLPKQVQGSFLLTPGWNPMDQVTVKHPSTNGHNYHPPGCPRIQAKWWLIDWFEKFVSANLGPFYIFVLKPKTVHSSHEDPSCAPISESTWTGWGFSMNWGTNWILFIIVYISPLGQYE